MLQPDEDVASLGGDRDGPRSHDELFAWPGRCLGSLRVSMTGVDFLICFLVALQGGLAITTDYSGVGTPEVCLAMLQQAVQLMACDIGVGMLVRRASDVNPCCRKVLMSHAGASQPQCVPESERE